MQNKQKKILFRADSSSAIGTGHIMRDLVLASQYKDANIIFAVQDLDGNINHKIKEANYKLYILKSNNIKELNKLIKRLNINILVIDHYSINYKFEKKMKKNNKKLKILSFDDTYEKHHCDILLNHNISGDKKRYKGLVPKDCELRCGSKYTLLREEFLQEMSKMKEKNKQYKKTKHKNNQTKIFISMGGTDNLNLNTKILEVLKEFNNIKIDIVTTTANKNLNNLQKYIKDSSSNIKLHINTNKIAKLMNNSNLAIVTPSVTVNEIHFLNIPFIAIKTIDNQNEIFKYLKKNNYLVLNNFNHLKLKRILKNSCFI